MGANLAEDVAQDQFVEATVGESQQTHFLKVWCPQQARGAPAAGICLVSHMIASILGVEVSVLMGANLAEDVAQDDFCEATVGEFHQQNHQNT